MTNASNDLKEFLRQAAHVTPSPRQLQWYELEFYAFVHFSPNTYTGLEWGRGDEDERIFNPTELDCDQWVEAVKSAGMKGLILTAKHHDGFCLWPSRYTEHSVKNCPVKVDVVREAAEACRRGGIAFGFYLSPWDRNSPLYGTAAYNEYYQNQLTELLTEYGDIFCVWLDGACGEGPNGRKQVYDFPGIIRLVRKYQPNAVIFQDGGPDVRWIGNESGRARRSEWAVVPHELCKLSPQTQTGPGPWYVPGADQLDYVYNTQENLGVAEQIARSAGLNFCGAEVDMSIRPGWFYHPEEAPHSVERLMQAYLNSVGHNACLNLNIPPAFGRELAKGRPLRRIDRPAGDQCEFLLELDRAEDVRYIELREPIEKGQRISEYFIEWRDENGQWSGPFGTIEGTTVGHRQIHDRSAAPIRTDALRVLVTSARDRMDDLTVMLY